MILQTVKWRLPSVLADSDDDEEDEEESEAAESDSEDSEDSEASEDSEEEDESELESDAEDELESDSEDEAESDSASESEAEEDESTAEGSAAASTVSASASTMTSGSTAVDHRSENIKCERPASSVPRSTGRLSSPPMDQHTDRRAQATRRVRVFMMPCRWCRRRTAFPDCSASLPQICAHYIWFSTSPVRPDPHDQISLRLAEVSNVNTSASTCHEVSP